MTQDTAHMPLNKRGLEAAYSVGRDYVMEMDDRTKQMLRVSIRAYLQTAAADVSGLVNPDMPAQQLRMHLGEMTAQEMRTARAAIRLANSSISARNAALEAENERLRGDMRRIIDAPLIDHSNPHNNPASIARAALSAPKGGQNHG